MEKQLFFICCIISFFSCNPCEKYSGEKYPDDTFTYQFDSAGIISMNTYFKKYDEPELRNWGFETYRLAVGHVFSDTFHIIRIGQENFEYYFMHKKLVSLNDSAYSIASIIEKKVSTMEWRALKKTIYQNEYWTLPREINRHGLDGSGWTIEGRRPDAENCGKRGYHVVNRWSPKEGKFRRIGEKFIELTEKLESTEFHLLE